MCVSLPPWQRVEEPSFRKNCSCPPAPDLSVGNCGKSVFLGLLGQRAAGSWSAFQPPMPPSGKKYPWPGCQGRFPGERLPPWEAGLWGGGRTSLLSRGKVKLGWCLGSGAVSFPEGEEYCLLPLSTCKSKYKEEIEGILPQEWLWEGPVSLTLPLKLLCCAEAVA